MIVVASPTIVRSSFESEGYFTLKSLIRPSEPSDWAFFRIAGELASRLSVKVEDSVNHGKALRCGVTHATLQTPELARDRTPLSRAPSQRKTEQSATNKSLFRTTVGSNFKSNELRLQPQALDSPCKQRTVIGAWEEIRTPDLRITNEFFCVLLVV